MIIIRNTDKLKENKKSNTNKTKGRWRRGKKERKEGRSEEVREGGCGEEERKKESGEEEEGGREGRGAGGKIWKQAKKQ